MQGGDKQMQGGDKQMQGGDIWLVGLLGGEGDSKRDYRGHAQCLRKQTPCPGRPC